MIRERLLGCVSAVLILLTQAGWAETPDSADRLKGEAIAGYVEKIKVYPGGVKLSARLDTGAQTSSINAPDKELFDKGDDEWVRFTVANEDGDEAELELPVERTVIIRQASGGTERRPVVMLGFCVRDVFREVEVNLSDRSEMSHPVLVGRNYLEGHILVDSADSKLYDPECDVPVAYK